MTKFTTESLQELKLTLPDLHSATISGIHFKQLKRNSDARGELLELWSQPWSEMEDVMPEVKHVYWNITHQGVTKAWHMHEKTVSQYTCVQGKMQVVLVDVREDSPTLGHVNQFLVGSFNPAFIKIPPGILKGWKSIAGDSVIVNLLTSADLQDNIRFAWDAILKDVWLPKMG